MLLTITTTHAPATDLGFLLHKHPDRFQTFPLASGKAHVFYPEASSDRCSATLLLDLDPVALVRRQGAQTGIDAYVNDRPYVASSFLSAAIAQVYGSALNGQSRERPELVAMPIPLRVEIASVPCRGSGDLIDRLFAPFGYEVTIRRHPLDERFPEWGEGRYYHVELATTRTVQQLLRHLYVLIPVLDDDKHYWVSQDEVEKLLRHGEEWLGTHPERDLIADRYLRHQRRLTRDALARLLEENPTDPDEQEESELLEEEAGEVRLGLNEQRLGAVLAALRGAGARRVLDLGCGEGKLLRQLAADPFFEEVVGVDVSVRRLELARDRLNGDRLPARLADRVKLLHGSLIYRDRRLAGYDAAAVVEVIEHLDPPRLAAFEQVLFGAARPATVVVTTPNVEYNVRFPDLAAGRFRHRDHRFEWTRAELGTWASSVGGRYGYRARLVAIGPEDAEVGSPTQMAVFSRPETNEPDVRGSEAPNAARNS